jgi:glycosyltransferase involved in cell wall biosynthesis
MKIGIDARELLNVYNPTWTYYLYSLISGLQEIDGANEYILFFNFFRKRFRHLLNKHTFNKNFRTKTLRMPHKIAKYIFEDLHLPIEMVSGKVDVFHGPIYSRLNNIFGRSVVTIHDLIFIRESESVHPGWREFAKKSTDYSVRKADLIITVSEFSKAEIIDVYRNRISEDRIRVIHNGVGKEFFPRTEGIEELKRKYGIKGRYLLFVGAIEPRKNLLALVKAFHNLQHPARDKYELVVTGVKRYRYEEVFQKVKELHLQNVVIFTGRVTREELPVLYSGAEVFVFPSLFEGFGMPPLEAMACGTPVIASNLTSIPEVVGDAALLVNPRNPDEITQAMVTILSDSRLKETLRQDGFKRTRMFSWEKTTKETLRLYHEVV